MSDFNHLCGWVDDPVLREEAFSAFPEHCKKPFQISGVKAATRRMMLFEVSRKVLAQQKNIDVNTYGDFINIAQQIGDCTSWSGKHTVEYLQAGQIAMGNMDELKLVFSPYIYGCGRVLIGRGQLGWGDGSTGAFTSQAVVKYGVIPTDTPNCPKYSGSVAKKWGNSSDSLDPFISIGQKNPVKTVAKITEWDELVDAITNLHSVSVCSNVGFSMQIGSDGFFRAGPIWNHAMTIIGVDDEGGDVEPHAAILNSWGESAHGNGFKDLRDKNLQWPLGTLRVRKRDVQRMLSQDDSYAYSAFIGFPGQTLNEEFFSNL